MTRPSTRHLVAPELLQGLDGFPTVDFSNGVEPYRGPIPGLESPPLPPELEAVECIERFVPGPEGAPDVRILHYVPPGTSSDARPALLHIHGGGYVLGIPELNDASSRMTALALGCVVVSTSYRLAPETIWPGARDDCFATLCWMVENAGELGIDPQRIAIGGESAGGGHAAALAIHARNSAGPAICLQVLDSPMLDDRTCITSEPHPNVGEFIWTPETNRFGWKSLLGLEPGGPDVRDEMVPARTKDLSGLPPTFISVGALDLFLEEDMDYARHLTRAGVPTEMHVIPGAFHGFTRAGDTPLVRQASDLRLSALARAFGITRG